MKAFEWAVNEAFSTWYQDTDDVNQAKLVDDTKLRTVAYGVIDRDAHLTNLGRQLYELPNGEVLLYNKLFTHNLHIVKSKPLFDRCKIGVIGNTGMPPSVSII